MNSPLLGNWLCFGASCWNVWSQRSRHFWTSAVKCPCSPKPCITSCSWSRSSSQRWVESQLLWLLSNQSSSLNVHFSVCHHCMSKPAPSRALPQHYHFRGSWDGGTFAIIYGPGMKWRPCRSASGCSTLNQQNHGDVLNSSSLVSTWALFL